MVIASGPLEAMACIKGENALRGTVKFFPVNWGTLIVAEITGLPENDSGFFSLHIHEGTECTGSGYSEAGAHYNPEDLPHPSHAGDLPPLLSRNGRAFLAVETDRFNAWEVVGRTVVIHGQADDFRSQPAGNAGSRIGCAIIRAC